MLCQCSSATNRLITSKDHASVQINIGHVDENGVYTGQFSTYALCGYVRAQVLFNPSLIFCISGLMLDWYLMHAFYVLDTMELLETNPSTM